ncbi:hypothetical protein AGMMS49531_01050 [Endomicrobiia bacterium]|nr:hypothetical protein AGMMS49531_01050 [Endomicrobiia bacterium]
MADVGGIEGAGGKGDVGFGGGGVDEGEGEVGVGSDVVVTEHVTLEDSVAG